jgi:hypothetical protein
MYNTLAFDAYWHIFEISGMLKEFYLELLPKAKGS